MMVFFIGLTVLSFIPRFGRALLRGLRYQNTEVKTNMAVLDAMPGRPLMQPQSSTTDTVESLAQTEAIDQRAILFYVRAFQIIEQLAPLAHHPQQTAAGMMVFDVNLEVFGQFGDTGRQQCNLNFRR